MGCEESASPPVPENADDPSLENSPMEEKKGIMQTPRCIFRYDNPLFVEEDFDLSVLRRKVVLEFTSTNDGATIIGFVRVHNMAYHKYVAVRFSSNNWDTWSETEAHFIGGDSVGQADRFMFEMTFPGGFVV